MSDDTRRLSQESLAQGDPTGWFEKLYAEAGAGTAEVPWDSQRPSRLLAEWVQAGAMTASGRTALVIGCGLGRDAEFLAGLGFTTTAFDISPTAIRSVRERFPDSAVDYVVADLLDPPAEWVGAFDLVVESITVQSMPLSVRADAIVNVARMVAHGGDLVVISGVREEGEQVDGPPWPLTRSEVDSFAVHGLRATRVEQGPHPEDPDALRWRAHFASCPGTARP